jgi:hypothetical protein
LVYTVESVQYSFIGNSINLFIQFCLYSSILCYNVCIFSSFLMPAFLIWIRYVQPFIVLKYFTSTDSILFISLALTGQNSLPHNKDGNTSYSVHGFLMIQSRLCVSNVNSQKLLLVREEQAAEL